MATNQQVPKPATEKQVKLLSSLVKQIELSLEEHAQMRAQADRGMTSKEASAWIGRFFDRRTAARASNRQLVAA
jgi:hypothetical protein